MVLNTDGYFSSNGFYFLPNDPTAYVRKDNWAWWPATAGCYNCGRYYAGTPGYWYFTSYSYSPVSATVSEDVLTLAVAARMEVQNHMAKEQQRHLNKLDFMDRTGITGTLGFQGFFGGRLNVPVNLVAGPVGKTVYGSLPYSALEIKTNGLDLNLLAQQLDRGMASNQATTNLMFSGVKETLQLAAADEYKLREIGMRAIASTNLQKGAAEVFRSTEPQPGATLRKLEFGPRPAGPEMAPAPGPMPPAAGGNAAYLQLAGVQKCAACHVQKAEGGFSISKFDPQTASPEDRGRVAGYLIKTDGKGCNSKAKDFDNIDFVEILTGKPRN